VAADGSRGDRALDSLLDVDSAVGKPRGLASTAHMKRAAALKPPPDGLNAIEENERAD